MCCASAGKLVSEWCPFPPVLGPMVLGKLYPASNLAVFPLRSRGDSIEVSTPRTLLARLASGVPLLIPLSCIAFMTGLH